MKRAVYQPTGLGNEARDVLDNFLDLKDETGKITRVQERTGFRVQFAQKQMLKYVQSGVRADNNLVDSKKKMVNLAVAQLSTERQLGLQAGTLDDHFIDVVNHAKMSNTQVNLMGKNMRDVAHNTGLTGQKLAEAISSSKQFNNNMLNAGNLTAESMKNVTTMTANFKKFGVEQAGGELLNYLTDANKLFMGANDPIANIARQAAALGGVSQELLDGTITKSEKTNKAFTQGLIEYRKQISGVENEEAFNAMSDAQKAMINRQVAAATQGKLTIGELFRMERSQLESTMTFSEKIAKLDKQRLENKGKEGSKEGRLLRLQLDAQEKELKKSKALDIIGDLAATAEMPDVKTTADVFKKFQGPEGVMEKKGYTKDIATLFNMKEEDVRNAGIKTPLKNTMMALAEELDIKMKKEGISGGVGVTPADIEMALNNKDKLIEVVQKLQESEQALNTQKQENLDPSTKALHMIQKNVDEIVGIMQSEFLIKHAKPGELLDRSAQELADILSKIAVEGALGGSHLDTLLRGTAGAQDYAAIYAALTGDTGISTALATPALSPELQASVSRGGANMSNMLPEIAYGIGSMFNNLFASVTGTTTPTPSLPIREVGTNMVTKEGLSYLHAGERIIPKEYAQLSQDTGKYVPDVNMNNDPLSWKDYFRTLEYNKKDRAANMFSNGTRTLKYMYGEDEQLPKGRTTLEHRFGEDNTQFYPKQLSKLGALATPNTLKKAMVDRILKQMMEKNITKLKGDQNESYPSFVNNELASNQGRVQSQISSFNDNAGKLNMIEEKNSSEMVSILIDIRDELKRKDNSGNATIFNNSIISDLLMGRLNNKTKTDPRLGTMKGGDYSKNDSIKAANY
jgi:hypothetical protein